MTRRKLFGFSLPALIAADLAWAGDLPKPQTLAETKEIDRANLKLRQGPTMEMLIGLAETGPERTRAYYGQVLMLALEYTGPLVCERPSGLKLYQSGRNAIPWHQDLEAYHIADVQYAFNRLIPEQILPAIRPENRGYSFPRNVPFISMTP